MQSFSLLCSSNSLSPQLSLSIPQQFTVPFQSRSIASVITSSYAGQLQLNSSRIHCRNSSSLHSTATQEIIETSQTQSEFVEIGFICGVHGLQGEVRVKTNTDFPELRFSEPGRRWLKQQVLGRETIQEVELVEGRGHPGQKGWIVRFSKVDTIEQAQQLVGSSVLVTVEDRPELEEGEFYTRDLIGMTVILKESGKPVGTVVNVCDSGASDLLQVMLNSSIEMPEKNVKTKLGKSASDSLVWVPFVEAIVPNVDMDRREMLITPPKGLLELNLRSDERSKKERRQLEWKERKKFSKRLIAAKKKLVEMEQKHVFHGLNIGEKAQRNSLADQIVGVNSKLLQVALQSIEIPSKRWNLPEYLTANLTEQMRSTFRSSEECRTTQSGKKLNASSKLLNKSHFLTSEGKVALVLVVDGPEKLKSGPDCNLLDSERTKDSPCGLLQTLLSDYQKLAKMEDCISMPLILVCPSHAIGSLQNLFADNDHFGFDSKKVWFLEEEKLPVVNSSLEEQSKHKILMKSPWEILQKPVGSGGVISLLSSHNIVENLSEMGVEYIEVCSVNQRNVCGLNLLSQVNSCRAYVGIEIFKGMDYLEDNFHMVFSMKFMKQLTKQIDELHFHTIPKANPHVVKVDKEWVDITPSSPNSYEICCFIYSSLKACPPSKVCVMEVTD